MKRRRLLQGLAAGALGVAGGGALWLRGDAPPVADFPDPTAALAFLDGLTPSARATGTWPLAQVLQHAAQSIEYSMSGYPALRPAWFRASVGPLALRVFARRGRMRHDTAEPIPGAPAPAEVPLTDAVARLRAALLAFEAWPADRPLAPHFAYGALDKDGFRRAHLLHLADHAREIEFG